MQIHDVTQQNGELVEQAAAAAESMQEQVEKLTQLIGSFKLISGTPETQLIRPQIISRRVTPNAPLIKSERNPTSLSPKQKNLTLVSRNYARKKL